jgi:protein-disulfide isomerase
MGYRPQFTSKNTAIKPIIIAIAILLIIAGGYIFFNHDNDEEPLNKELGVKSSGIDGNKKIENVQDVEEVIAKWIEANPEAIIQSVTNMQQKMMEEKLKDAQKSIGEKKSQIFDKKAPAYKPKGYDVTIVEFYDYNCGYCKRANSSVKELLQDDKKVSIIYRDLPILGQASEELAIVSLAADFTDPSKFMAFHNKLMNSEASTQEDAIAVAKSVGINEAKLRKVLSDKKDKIMQIINENRKLASEIGIQGTPAFVIGDELIPGAIDANTLKQKIKAAR